MDIDHLTEADRQSQKEIKRIICFGDSITAGGWPAHLQSKLEQWGCYRWGVLNKGVNGDTTARALDRLDSEVLPSLPGLLIIEFGINDSNHRPWAQVPRVGLDEYEKNLREFYRLATSHDGSCLFIVNHLLMPVDGKFVHQGNGRTYQENLEPYNERVRKIANALKAPYVDLPQRLRETQVDLGKFLDVDGVHLTSWGNRIYADIVFEVLTELFEKNEHSNPNR